MKPLIYIRTVTFLAIAMAATAGFNSQAQDQPVPPTAMADDMPATIVPGSPLSDVLKMIRAGVESSTIESYIGNCQTPFDLDTDKILYLKDAGVPNELINAMMNRDKVLYAVNIAPPPTPQAAAPAPAPMMDTTATTAVPPVDVAPPTTDMTTDDFNSTLNPYGTWINVGSYGRCWRPTVALYDANWSPYCDRGHWVYTDYGWYWDSDYAWGLTFHYGRWFRSPQFGWCWYPDTVWAPSWVVWRSDTQYCGWAPLPPFAVYHPGAGFFYRGISVRADFDFGLAADCFIFLTPDHFCDRRPRLHCVPRDHIVQVYHQTTIINNYNVHDKVVVNQGFGVERITKVTHRQLEPVHVSSLPNAGRQGWRGENFQRTMHPSAVNYNPGRNSNNAHSMTVENNQVHRSNDPMNNRGVGMAGDHRENVVSPTHVATQDSRQPQVYHLQPQNPQPTVGNQSPAQKFTVQQPPAHQNNTAAQNSHPAAQNNWQQNRDRAPATFQATGPHGAAELPQHPERPASPRQDPHENGPSSAAHPQNQGSPQNQPQPKGGNGGSNNNPNRGQGKQN